MKNLLLAGLVLLLGACASHPDFDYDKSVDFSQYKTFAWIPNASLTKGTNNYQISELMERRVQQAVNDELRAKGMELVSLQQADVLINYHASVDTKVDVDTFSTGYGARWDYWGIGYNVQTTTREYEVGTLVIDVVDRSSNQLVWRAAKEGRLKKNQTPIERTEVVRESVADILSNFPPQAQ
ncbi:hypothetical protein FIU82_09790 [Pseudoalteromonas sp. THAF3]|uniref:DUF4136 domain-containing protein n=1 Tax=Pseudoalteromonas sp. THAF3 TaxID=2587843 RepID=UPI0012687B61|nr:DUF4136 domain-containing protein [Pseudoalteromonas sp. THAF3]QFU05297.1 hypothetical protein FIU82_09790 [Pseudoalteromonas sp. THAF3]